MPANDDSVIEQYHKAQEELRLSIMGIAKLTDERLAQMTEDEMRKMLTNIRELDRQVRTLSLEPEVMRFEMDSVTAQR